MSNKNKNKNIKEYIAKIKELAKLENFDKIKTIQNNFFVAHIAKGSDSYKLHILKHIIENTDIPKNSYHYNKNEKIAIENNFKNPTYLTIIRCNKEKMFKYFDAQNIEQICSHFGVNFELLKLEYTQYLDSLKSIPLTIENIRSFLSSKENEQQFIKNIHMTLNMNNFCKTLNIKKEQELALTKQLNDLIYNEQVEKNKLIQQEQVEKQLILDAKNIKEWKVKLPILKKKALTLSEIYPLLDNEYVITILNKHPLTIDKLAKYFKLPIDMVIYEAKKNELSVQHCYGKDTSVHNMHIESMLGITAKELKNWKEIDRLIPTEYRQFSKWGKTLYSDYFSVDYLALITPNDINSWRMQDQLVKQQLKKSKMKDSISKTTESLSITNIEKSIKFLKYAQTKGFVYKTDKWYCLFNLNINNHIIKQFVEVKLKKEINNYASEEKLVEDLNVLQSKIDITKEEQKLIVKIDSYELTPEIKEKMLVHLSSYTEKLSLTDFSSNTITKTMESHLAVFLQIKQKQKIINDLKIEQYETGYPLARSIARDIKIIVGPTNSGKTYEALQHLMRAKSGVYLAPLRLLAMEISDKLNAAGVPCNLITGEERILIQGACHTSSTIEMMNQSQEVDVAIIDEFQMLDDIQRGWAWTSAMVGVPAKTVYVIGNEQKLSVSTKLFQHLGESCEIIKKERFNKLNHLEQPVELTQLQKGDALIAFSRKDILSYATLLRQKKYTVSIIYGALSPEVRRKQADLFNSGQTDIVISTDAIGMGLNLPIKRIIFATINKYDGQKVRQLKTSELLQIAGRAGRYGLHEEGFVGLLKNKVNDTYAVQSLKNMLTNTLGDSYKKLQVAPTDWHINIISEILKTKDLGKILLCFNSLRYNSIYETANLEQMVLLYGHVKQIVKPLSLKEQYHLITAPVELHNEDLVEYYKDLVHDIVNQKEVFFSADNYYDLESAELENKKLTIFAWLSFYYNKLDTYNINEERNLLSHFIQNRLKQESNYGFSKMIEPQQSYRDY